MIKTTFCKFLKQNC